MKYLIILEETQTGFSAYSPDLPGCIATGKSVEETEFNMQGAVKFHLEGMREDGMELPRPLSRVSYFEVTA